MRALHSRYSFERTYHPQNVRYKIIVEGPDHHHKELRFAIDATPGVERRQVRFALLHGWVCFAFGLLLRRGGDVALIRRYAFELAVDLRSTTLTVRLKAAFGHEYTVAITSARPIANSM